MAGGAPLRYGSRSSNSISILTTTTAIFLPNNDDRLQQIAIVIDPSLT